GEILIDFINPETDTPGVTTLGVEVAFSPLFHIPSNTLDIVIGPKLCGFAPPISDGSNTETISGYLLGVNAGLFAGISPSMAIGGLVSFSIREPTKVCF